MSEPTQPDSCKECPLYGIGKGFVLGSGDPKRAKYMVVLEAPGREEIQFRLTPNPNRAFLQTKEQCDAEISTRRRDYPDLDGSYISTGVPVVGATGGALQWWIFPKLGIRREEVYFDNTLRCLPPKSKSGDAYPTGDVKKEAERCCRQYDRLGSYRPDTIILSLHPASLLREITPLPLVVKDFEKVRDFTSQGRRVLTLLGGKAASAFARYGGNSTRWRGHWQALSENWTETYKSLFEFVRKRRKKKVTEDEVQGEFLSVPGTVLEKARAKVTRPETLNPNPCKSAKRYRGKGIPKCGCVSCWTKYEQAHGIQIPS